MSTVLSELITHDFREAKVTDSLQQSTPKFFLLVQTMAHIPQLHLTSYFKLKSSEESYQAKFAGGEKEKEYQGPLWEVSQVSASQTLIPMNIPEIFFKCKFCLSSDDCESTFLIWCCLQTFAFFIFIICRPTLSKNQIIREINQKNLQMQQKYKKRSKEESEWSREASIGGVTSDLMVGEILFYTTT